MKRRRRKRTTARLKRLQTPDPEEMLLLDSEDIEVPPPAPARALPLDPLSELSDFDELAETAALADDTRRLQRQAHPDGPGTEDVLAELELALEELEHERLPFAKEAAAERTQVLAQLRAETDAELAERREALEAERIRLEERAAALLEREQRVEVRAGELKQVERQLRERVARFKEAKRALRERLAALGAPKGEGGGAEGPAARPSRKRRVVRRRR